MEFGNNSIVQGPNNFKFQSTKVGKGVTVWGKEHVSSTGWWYRGRDREIGIGDPEPTNNTALSFQNCPSPGHTTAERETKRKTAGGVDSRAISRASPLSASRNSPPPPTSSPTTWMATPSTTSSKTASVTVSPFPNSLDLTWDLLVYVVV
ncbi:synaptobrevin-related protein 1 [Actinidia rufa]|uniref:Synaptobrevin-related protein 1 n=1 Tax=Actinidia rufa TaxID=165716 RepID=A0A7J0ERI4_9ERIC|nr:synaptobrevin-related protein 1 [Actinidia rufa]